LRPYVTIVYALIIELPDVRSEGMTRLEGIETQAAAEEDVKLQQLIVRKDDPNRGD
jgi:hypothetical protein